MDDDNPLLNIQLSDSDSDAEASAAAAAAAASEQPSRTGQSEAAFQAIRASYRPKQQDGDLHKSIWLPLGPASNKQLVQDVVHAVEELYFFRRYAEAVDFVARAMPPDGEDGLDRDSRALLRVYEAKCRQKAAFSQA